MIDIRLGALEDVVADAIIRPVSSDFSPVTPTMRRFDEAAGRAVAAQCAQLGDLPVGSAVITAAGELQASFIIHVAVRDAADNATRTNVRTGFLNALRRAGEWESATVAVAPLGTGAGNLDAETAADVMLEVLAEYIQGGAGPEKVILILEDAYQEAAFTGAVERHLGRTAETL